MTKEEIHNRSAWLKQETLMMWMAQRCKCHYCKLNTVFVPKWPNRTRPDVDWATTDHKLSINQGGTDDENNRVMSCLGCNMLKGNTKYQTFVDLVNTIMSTGEEPSFQNIKLAMKYFSRYKKIPTAPYQWKQHYR